MASFPLPSVLALIRSITIPQPAANAEIAPLVVPSGKWWMLISVSIGLVQGATQTPQPILFVDDGTNTILESIGSTAVQAASTTTVYNWGPGFVATGQVGTGAGVHSNAPVPDGLILPGGYRIGTNTLGLGANSRYNAGRLFVVELG